MHFDGTGVTDPEGHQMSFTWSFGDGTANLTGTSADHQYVAAGTYTATLSVTDNGTPALTAPATKDFTITVRPPGAVNRPPDCSAATVTPTSGPGPLAVTLDASGCVDPDGDPLAFTWRVPRSYTTEDVFDGATAQTTITEPGTTEIRLHVREVTGSPLEIDLTFPVTLEEDAGGVVYGSCGCTAAAGADVVGVLAALGLLISRRRRR